MAVVYQAGPTGFGLVSRDLSTAGIRCEVAAPSKLHNSLRTGMSFWSVGIPAARARSANTYRSPMMELSSSMTSRQMRIGTGSPFRGSVGGSADGGGGVMGLSGELVGFVNETPGFGGLEPGAGHLGFAGVPGPAPLCGIEAVGVDLGFGPGAGCFAGLGGGCGGRGGGAYLPGQGCSPTRHVRRSGRRECVPLRNWS